MALALTAAFFLMNGYELRASADESEELIVRVAGTNGETVAGISQWLEAHIHRL